MCSDRKNCKIKKNKIKELFSTHACKKCEIEGICIGFHKLNLENSKLKDIEPVHVFKVSAFMFSEKKKIKTVYAFVANSYNQQ